MKKAKKMLKQAIKAHQEEHGAKVMFSHHKTRNGVGAQCHCCNLNIGVLA